MERHSYNIFPEMNAEDYSRLLLDIKVNGYDKSQPIYLFEGKILDGWNRQKACRELDIEPEYKEFTGEKFEAIQFVMRTNKRRNLTSSQWAAIAAEADDLWDILLKQVEEERIKKMTESKTGMKYKQNSPVNKFPHEKPERTTEKLAENFNTNYRYVSDAKKYRETNPEVFESIKSGEKSIAEVKKDEKIQKRKKELQIINETKSPDVKEIMDVRAIPYDENIFTVSSQPSAARFGDTVFSLKDERYYTATTLGRFFHKETLMEFSLREYAHVQTFPVDYKFIGTNQQIKKQIGNAVAPDMGEYITKKLKGKTCGDLFAGCGGFTAGAHRNGITTLWAVEWEEIAAQSYKLNFPKAKVVNTNIKTLDPNELDKVDIIIGGPPCQGFSNAGSINSGKRTFKSDPRNELYKEFVRFVDVIKPGEFIMENVKEIQDVKDEIIIDFESLGYKVETILCKGNEIGMKQNRVRFFFIGVKI